MIEVIHTQLCLPACRNYDCPTNQMQCLIQIRQCSSTLTFSGPYKTVQQRCGHCTFEYSSYKRLSFLVYFMQAFSSARCGAPYWNWYSFSTITGMLNCALSVSGTDLSLRFPYLASNTVCQAKPLMLCLPFGVLCASGPASFPGCWLLPLSLGKT